MSDRQAADTLYAAAARHFAQAIELEKYAQAVVDPAGDTKP